MRDEYFIEPNVVVRMADHGVHEVSGPLLLRMPDGITYRVRPGPYGKGISVTPLMPANGAAPRPSGTGTRGRKPRPSTVALRRRLADDVRKGDVAAPRDYVKWLLKQDDDVSLAVARQVVYRERRRALEAT